VGSIPTAPTPAVLTSQAD